MAVTIYDIAKELNISATTVSRVLNGKKSELISKATQERVQKVAKELGYRPNRLARALVTGSTYNIAIYSKDMYERSGMHFARMIEAIEPKARASNFKILVCGDLESISGQGAVDGVIMLSSLDDSVVGVLPDDLPRIFVWDMVGTQPHSVSWSDVEGGYKGGQYLLGLGHKRMAFISGELPINAKYKGFRMAMEDAGVYWEEWTGTNDPDQLENSYQLVKEKLRERNGITAIMARNDILAIGAVKAIVEAGLSIPGDISVLGYNDTLVARCAMPALTSIRTPIAEAGERAVEVLIQAIEAKDKREDFPGVSFAPTITERASCAPPK